MKITILGCGPSGGVPAIGGAREGGDWGSCDPDNPKNTRSRSSIIIEDDEGTRLLVDCGPDLRAQLLRQSIARINGLIMTHEHSDHIAGFDDIRGVNRAMNAPLNLYSTQVVLDALKDRFPYAFRPWVEGSGFFRPVPIPHVVEVPGICQINGMDVALFKQLHYRVETLGLRIKNFAYSTDVKSLSEKSISVLKGIDTWVVGCLQYEDHIAHACLTDVLDWCDKIRPRRVILTHMGPEMDYDTLRHRLPAGIEPAYDGMEVTV